MPRTSGSFGALLFYRRDALPIAGTHHSDRILERRGPQGCVRPRARGSRTLEAPRVSSPSSGTNGTDAHLRLPPLCRRSRPNLALSAARDSRRTPVIPQDRRPAWHRGGLETRDPYCLSGSSTLLLTTLSSCRDSNQGFYISVPRL